MPMARFLAREARRNFTKVLKRAIQGEEIVIVRGSEVCARIGPGDPGSKRPFGLLRHHALPDDLFDEKDPGQEAIDAGDWK